MTLRHSVDVKPTVSRCLVKKVRTRKKRGAAVPRGSSEVEAALARDSLMMVPMRERTDRYSRSVIEAALRCCTRTRLVALARPLSDGNAVTSSAMSSMVETCRADSVVSLNGTSRAVSSCSIPCFCDANKPKAMLASLNRLTRTIMMYTPDMPVRARTVQNIRRERGRSCSFICLLSSKDEEDGGYRADCRNEVVHARLVRSGSR